MLTDEDVVFLVTRTWSYLDFGASHFYGDLRPRNNYFDGQVEVTYRVTATDLSRLRASEYELEIGDACAAFFSLRKLRRVAIELFHERFPSATLLVEGNRATADPQLILIGPKSWKERVNTLFSEAEEIGWYDGGQEKRMEEVYNEWQELRESYPKRSNK